MKAKDYRIYIQKDGMRATFYIRASSKNNAIKYMASELDSIGTEDILRIVETASYNKQKKGN